MARARRVCVVVLLLLVAVSTHFAAADAEAQARRSATTYGAPSRSQGLGDAGHGIRALPDHLTRAVRLTLMYYYSVFSPGEIMIPPWISALDYGALCKDDAHSMLYFGAGNLAVVSQDPTTLMLKLISSRYTPGGYRATCYFANKNQMFDIVLLLSGSVDIHLVSRASGKEQRLTLAIDPPPGRVNPVLAATTTTSGTNAPKARSIPNYDPLVSPFPRKPFGIDHTSRIVVPFDNGCIAYVDMLSGRWAFGWARLEHIIQVLRHPSSLDLFYVLGYTRVEGLEWTVLVYATMPDLSGYDGRDQNTSESIPLLDPLSALNTSVMTELNTRCPHCQPVAFVVLEEGLAVVLNSWENNAMYVAVVTHWSLSPDFARGQTDGPPQGDWSTTTTTPTPTEPFADDDQPTYKYTMMNQLIDEICNVSFVMEDTYTHNLLVSMICEGYGSQLLLITLSDLKIVAHRTLSLPGSSTPYIGLSGIVDTRSRTVKLLVPRIPWEQAIMDVSLVVPASVTPRAVVDGSTISIRGFGFVPRMVCFFPDHNSTFVDITFYNQSLVQCIVPPVVELSRHPLRVQLQLIPRGIEGAIDMPQCDCSFLFQPIGNLTILQVRKPTTQQAVECTTGSSFAFATNLCLRLKGEAFVEPELAPYHKCRIYSDRPGGLSYTTNVTFVNSREIICQFGADLEPMPDPVRVTVAVDGELYSPGGPTFFVLGYPTAITVTSINNRTDLNWTHVPRPAALATVSADTVTRLPTIVISIVDAVSHVIWPLDFGGRLDGIVVEWQQFDPTDVRLATDPVDASRADGRPPVSPASVRDGDSAATNAIRGTSKQIVSAIGTATFDDLALDCPHVADILLRFQVTEVPRGQEAFLGRQVDVLLSVEEGSPHALQFARPPSASVSPSVPFLQLQPIVGVADICGNLFRTLSLTDVGDVEIIVESYNFSGRQKFSTRWALHPFNNLFYADNVSVKGVQNTDYTLAVESPGLPVPRLVADTIHVEWCDANRLANLATGECLPCPEYAQCNGTELFLLQNGWWRAAKSSTEFLNCRRLCDEDVCLQDGACKAGYTGIRCSQCASGYRRQLTSCVKCPSRAVNSFLIFLLCVFYVLMPLGCILLMAVLPPSSHFVWALKTVILIIQFTSLYSELAMSWTAAARRLFSGTRSLTDLTIVVTSCSLDPIGSFAFFFAMPLVLWCVLTVLGRWMVLLFHLDRLDAHVLVAIVVRAYSHIKCQAFLDLRREIAHKYTSQRLNANTRAHNHVGISGNAADHNESRNDVSVGSRTALMRNENVSSANNILSSEETDGDRFDAGTCPFSQGPTQLLHPQAADDEPQWLPRTVVHELEVSAVSLFQAATGIDQQQLTDEQLCEALRNLSAEQLKKIASIRLPLPTRSQVASWTRTRDSRHGAYMTGAASVTKARPFSPDGAGGEAAGGDSAVGVEENYRLLAVRQFRTSWLGLFLNEFALIMVIFYLPILVNAFEWQKCQTLNYGVDDTRRVAFVDNNLSCDSRDYHRARNIGLAAIVLYGVAAPLILLVLTVYFKVRYGLDVAVAVFPTLHFGLPLRGALYEFAIFVEKLLMCVAVVFGRRAPLQAIILVWLIGARMLFDAFVAPYPHRGYEEPDVANLWGWLPAGRVTRWTNGLLFLMANMVLIAAYVTQSEDANFSNGAGRFVAVLLIVFFVVAVIMNVWLAVGALVQFIKATCGREQQRKDTERAHVFQSLVSLYAHICAAKRWYADTCERGLEVALRLDRIRKLNEESPIDDDLLRTLADEEQLQQQQGDTSRSRTAASYTFTSSGASNSWSAQAAGNTLSQAMRSGLQSRPFLCVAQGTHTPETLPRPECEPPLPVLSHPDLVVPDESLLKAAKEAALQTTASGAFPTQMVSDEKSANDVAAAVTSIGSPASEGSPDRPSAALIPQVSQPPSPSLQPASRGDSHAAASAVALDDVAADVASQFATIPRPTPQPKLHRRSSSLFSVRNMDTSPIAPNGSGSARASHGRVHATDIPPIVAGLVPFGGAPPPQLLPPTPVVGFQAFSRPPIEVDLASTFDPFKVAPLAAKHKREQPRLRRGTGCQGSTDGSTPRVHDDFIAAEVEALGLDRDVAVGGSLLDVSGIDVSELRSILDGAQISHGLGGLDEGTATGSHVMDMATPRSPQPVPPRDSSNSLKAPTATTAFVPTQSGTTDSCDPQPMPPPLPTFRTISSRLQVRHGDPRRTRTSSAPKSSKHRSSSKTKKK